MRAVILLAPFFFSLGSLAETTLLLKSGDYELQATLTGQDDNPFVGSITKDGRAECKGTYNFSPDDETLTISFTDPNTDECTIDSLSAEVGMADYMALMQGQMVETTIMSKKFSNQPQTATVKKI